MSLIPANGNDKQWPKELQKLCLECRENKSCIGLCDKAHSAVMQYMMPGYDNSKQPTTREIPKPQTGYKNSLVVYYFDKEGTLHNMGHFSLDKETREEFLPQWRALGESFMNEGGMAR